MCLSYEIMSHNGKNFFILLQQMAKQNRVGFNESWISCCGRLKAIEEANLLYKIMEHKLRHAGHSVNVVFCRSVYSVYRNLYFQWESRFSYFSIDTKMVIKCHIFIFVPQDSVYICATNILLAEHPRHPDGFFHVVWAMWAEGYNNCGLLFCSSFCSHLLTHMS